jgi:hypothetical protein
MNMGLEFANSMIADKIDRVAKASGLKPAAVVELALDLYLSDMSSTDQLEHMAARMAQLDRLRGRTTTTLPAKAAKPARPIN